MPLFRATGDRQETKSQSKKRRYRTKSCSMLDEEGSVLSLTHLCLLSLADNMKDVWAKDYADNYLDQYSFRHIMGPFNLLPGELVEELTLLLCNRKQLSRAALHLLLVPQLRALSLEKCPGLATSALCFHITARCQSLWSLDLSGAQLPSKTLSETLSCLPVLHSLCLAGTPCDGHVIRTIAQRCHFLRHLDVSRCHSLSPAALVPLGGGALLYSTDCPSSGSNSTSKSPTKPADVSPPPLSSLLALDIAFGEEEGDSAAAAAFLLLSLPYLERVAMEGVSQACHLIRQREFSHIYEFSDRKGLPCLEEVWRKRLGIDKCSDKRGGKKDEDEDGLLWKGSASESEEDLNEDEGKRAQDLLQSGDDHFVLRLKDVQGLSCDTLNSVSQLCPDIHSISGNIDNDGLLGVNQGSSLALSLQKWSGQLRSLSLNYQGSVQDLLPALQVSGSSLVFLNLEGVKTSPHTPLQDIIGACPKLRDLIISAEPPNTPQQEEEEEEEDVGVQQDDQDLLRLPNLHSLTLNFSYEHGQMKPVMSWMSLKKVLKGLLSGSSLLEKLSLVSLPCPLNCVVQDVLRTNLYADSANLPLVPLGRLRHINFQRTDVKIETIDSLMQQSKRVKCIDVSHCWKISRKECLNCASKSKAQLIWS
ncbi:uncharacterized protein LOC110001674 isoform X1 [Xyrichtys novacula]|nr:uncharacterized protein LOC110001674 isoform X1 [Xyrichtys novacula]